MATDWQVGDLAVCVERGKVQCPLQPPRTLHTGANLPATAGRVTDIVPARYESGPRAGQTCGCYNLHFADGTFGNSIRFRKILPDKKEACEPEFVQLLRRSNNRVSA